MTSGAPTFALGDTTIGPLSLDDAQEYVDSEDALIRQAFGRKTPTTPEMARTWIAADIDAWTRQKSDWRFAIRSAVDGHFAGWVRVGLNPEGYVIEAWVRPEDRRAHHALNALEMASHYGFCIQRVPRIEGIVRTDNMQSGGLAEKLGYRLVEGQWRASSRAQSAKDWSYIFRQDLADWLQRADHSCAAITEIPTAPAL